MYEIIPALALVVFIGITISLRKDAMRLIKSSRKDGALVLLLSKMMFWFTIIEISYLYASPFLLYILPTVLCLFLVYIAVDAKLFYQAITGKKIRTKAPKEKRVKQKNVDIENSNKKRRHAKATKNQKNRAEVKGTRKVPTKENNLAIENKKRMSN